MRNCKRWEKSILCKGAHIREFFLLAREFSRRERSCVGGDFRTIAAGVCKREQFHLGTISKMVRKERPGEKGPGNQGSHRKMGARIVRRAGKWEMR
jgi:hypothetical protein